MGGSSKGMPYEWKDDARYEYEQDSDSDVVRFEISLCFGRHKSRESCSDKVDSMLGKLAREKYEANPWHKYNDVITFALIMLGLMVASCILGLILMAIKQRNC